MKVGENLHVLIVEESKNDAESLATALRTAGHSINFNYGAETGAIENALQEQYPDIVVCGSGESLPAPNDVLALLGKHGLTAPMIVLADEAPEDKVVAARKSGFAALISYDQPDHLYLSFEKEATCMRLQQQLKASNDSLRDSENRCHSLIENSSDAVAYIHDGMHVYANQPYMELFSIETVDDIEGTPILDMICENERSTFRKFLKNYLANKDLDNTLEINCINASGELFQSMMELSPATMDGEPCTQIIIRVNSSNAALERKIKTLTQQDMVTGLSNRQYFLQLLKERMAELQTDNEHRALLYITLDNFKAIRDETGIEASDQALRDIAQILKSNCGENDCLSRLNDCSFAILHYDTDQEKTLGLGETLLHAIAGNLSEVNGRAITMTCSIGICTIETQASNAQAMIAYADMACEVARSSGGNQIHTHSHVVGEQAGSEQEQEQEWDKVIRATIDEERFYLAYQPIVSLKGDTQQRYEVLLRIVDSAGQVFLPGQFLAIADKNGLSHEIDRWIIDKAFRQLGQLIAEDKDISFYIKLSGGTLSDTGLPQWINEKLVENNLSGNSVVFEIAEQTAIKALTSAINFTKEIHKLPCKVALEHFGQSVQPQLLKHLPVDILKIHGALIGGLGNNKDHQKKVKEICEMARESNMQCIAECVDDAGSLAYLWQIGLDFIQGNFVQEPCKTIDYDFEGETA